MKNKKLVVIFFSLMWLALQIALIGLKLGGYLHISWELVLLPLIITLSLVVANIILFVIATKEG